MTRERRDSTPLIQDTGNPVLDSTVNLTIAYLVGVGNINADEIERVVNGIHPMILEIAQKEPGGLRRNSTTRSVEADTPEKRAMENDVRREFYQQEPSEG